MKFSAHVQNSPGDHRITLEVGGKEQTLSIAPKPTGGSSISGGELLFLALATCYCNDLYREAAKRDIKVENVDVRVEGDFEAEGKPAARVIYKAKVKANASQEQICELMQYVDSIAEIQATVRIGTSIEFEI